MLSERAMIHARDGPENRFVSDIIISGMVLAANVKHVVQHKTRNSELFVVSAIRETSTFASRSCVCFFAGSRGCNS